MKSDPRNKTLRRKRKEESGKKGLKSPGASNTKKQNKRKSHPKSRKESSREGKVPETNRLSQQNKKKKKN